MEGNVRKGLQASGVFGTEIKRNKLEEEKRP